MDEETIIVPKGNTEIVEDDVWRRKKLKKVKLPEGLLSIGEKSFAYCDLLEEIKIPDSVTKIGAKAFYGCKKLKKIILPNGLKSIGYSAFSNCESLEEIIMPDSVTNINKEYILPYATGHCFENCINLKKVKLSNNIEKIPKNCFGNCTSLEKVILPTKLETIEEYAFEKCTSLKSIVIPNGVKEIHDGAFCNCKNLKEIVIPSSMTKISPYAFRKCYDDSTFFEYRSTVLKIVTFNYESYETLRKFIIENLRFPEENPNIAVIFAGPKLSFIEKILVRLILEESFTTYTIGFKEGQVPIIIPEQQKKPVINMDDDIKKIIDDINEICSKLPEKNLKEIEGQIKKLLNEYNSKKEKCKPKIFEDEERISLEIESSDMLKPNLLATLNMIKLNLASEKKLIKFLSDLEKYKKLLTEDINELSNSNSIEEIIKNIIYYSKFFDEDKKNEYLTKLKKYIDIGIKKSNNRIGKNNKKEIELNTKYEQDYEEEFRLNVLKLYDDISAYASKIIPYKKLLDTLTTKEEINKPNLDNNTLTGLINGIKYIINNLSNSKYQDKLEEKLKEIANKYSKIIEESLKEPNDLNQTKYENLEHGIREELQPLLEQIRNYVYLDEYESVNINSANIISQLYSCKDIIEGKKQVTPTKEQNKEVLTSTIIYINNKSLELLHDQTLDDINKKRIENKLLNLLDAINTNIEELEAKPLGNIEEYYSKLKKILGVFIGIQLGIELFIKRNEKHISKTRTRTI